MQRPIAGSFISAVVKGELTEQLKNYPPYPATTSLYAVHPYQRFIPPKVRVFIEFLVQHFGEGYDWAKNPADVAISQLE